MATKGKRSVGSEQGVASKAVAQGSKPRTAAACRGWLKEARVRGVMVPAYSRLGAEELRALVARLEREAGEPVVVQESACRVTAAEVVEDTGRWTPLAVRMDGVVRQGVAMLPGMGVPMRLELPLYPAQEQVVPPVAVPVAQPHAEPVVWEPEPQAYAVGQAEWGYPVAVPACVPQPWAIPVPGSYPGALPVRRTPLAQRLVGMGLVVLLVAACLPLVACLVALGLVGLGVAGLVALAVRLPGWMRQGQGMVRRGWFRLVGALELRGDVEASRLATRLAWLVRDVAC